MNVPARTPAHDPETGEITTTGLPAGYQAGNQSLAVSMAMAEVDQQITTAHAYPRSVDRAVRNILALATLDEETAKECIYALPRGNKPIKGPSIRLAEIIQSQWGNNRTGTRVVHVDRVEKYVEAEGVFHDLETNSATTSRVRRRLSDRENRLLNEDMIIVTGNAASSIAKRNAILAGVPKAVWRKAYAAVEQVLVGNVMTMAEKREDALKAFAAFGVKPEQIFEVLDIAGLDDIGPDQYITLIGMHQALRSGEATVEEMFPVKRPKGDKPAGGLSGRLDQLAEGDGNKAGPDKKNSKSEAAASQASSDQPGKQSTPAASGAEPSSDQSLSRSDGGDPLASATRKGRAAYRKGMSRKAVPADLKSPERKAELDAYLAGFDDEADNDSPEPGSTEEDA